jgi:hypothetical protein
MDIIIASPTSCEVRAVIRFLHAGQRVAEVYRRLYHNNGDNVMSFLYFKARVTQDT